MHCNREAQPKPDSESLSQELKIMEQEQGIRVRAEYKRAEEQKENIDKLGQARKRWQLGELTTEDFLEIAKNIEEEDHAETNNLIRKMDQETEQIRIAEANAEIHIPDTPKEFMEQSRNPIEIQDGNSDCLPEGLSWQDIFETIDQMPTKDKIQITADFASEFGPAGDAKSIYACIAGENPVTGEKLNWKERLLSALSAIPGFGHGMDALKAGAKGWDKIIAIAMLRKSMQFEKNIAERIENLSKIRNPIEIRKIAEDIGLNAIANMQLVEKGDITGLNNLKNIAEVCRRVKNHLLPNHMADLKRDVDEVSSRIIKLSAKYPHQSENIINVVKSLQDSFK